MEKDENTIESSNKQEDVEKILKEVIEEIESNTTEEEKETSSHEEKSSKKIEVVTGDGNLTISPVYGHLEVEKPKPKENKKIFIPEVKGKAKSDSKD